MEQAGGFTLEKQPVSNSPLYKDAELNKEEVLKEIESVDNIIGIKNEVSFVDHLLTKPVESKEETKVQQPDKKEEERTYTLDPYREPTE